MENLKFAIEMAQSQIAEIEKLKHLTIKISPYFVYGSFGYFFDFYNSDGSLCKQFFTGLDTKKETLKNIKGCISNIYRFAEYSL